MIITHQKNYERKHLYLGTTSEATLWHLAWAKSWKKGHISWLSLQPPVTVESLLSTGLSSAGQSHLPENTAGHQTGTEHNLWDCKMPFWKGVGGPSKEVIYSSSDQNYCSKDKKMAWNDSGDDRVRHKWHHLILPNCGFYFVYVKFESGVFLCFVKEENFNADSFIFLFSVESVYVFFLY